MTNECIDCGREFTLTDGEVSFYNSKGFDLPKRCVDCRRKRKAQREQDGGVRNDWK